MIWKHILWHAVRAAVTAFLTAILKAVATGFPPPETA